MGRQTPAENRFRLKVREERERRGWSQADFSKRLQAKGIQGMYPSTVAKVESGERSVRIDEAAAIASLFGVSIDSLMGRRIGVENDLVYSLRSVLSTAKRSVAQVGAIQAALDETIRQDLLTIDFDGREAVEADAKEAMSALSRSVDALKRLAGFRLPSTSSVQLRIDRTFDAAFDRVLADVMLAVDPAPAPKRNKGKRAGK